MIEVAIAFAGGLIFGLVISHISKKLEQEAKKMVKKALKDGSV